MKLYTLLEVLPFIIQLADAVTNLAFALLLPRTSGHLQALLEVDQRIFVLLSPLELLSHLHVDLDQIL